jgi:hypothetical protein
VAALMTLKLLSGLIYIDTNVALKIKFMLSKLMYVDRKVNLKGDR